jgi:hypothetical protein
MNVTKVLDQQDSLLCCLVFIAEEIDGAGGKGSGDSTTIVVESLMDTFLKMSLRYTRFIL